MKAIIIAAGIGGRMKPLTDSLPKCMLDFNGKTLLEIQIETLRSYAINDISIIKGYMGDKISFPGVKYYTNDRYEHNNILDSLFYARPELDDEVVITYADIYYQRYILGELMGSRHDISIVVDTDWRASYIDRSSHPIDEAEKVRISPSGNVIEIGKNIEDGDAIGGEFLGIIKLSKKGCVILKEVFRLSKDRFWNKPFHEAPTFEKAYITDIIQELVDRQINVHCVKIKGGWKEIDTIQDYENAKKALRTI